MKNRAILPTVFQKEGTQSNTDQYGFGGELKQVCSKRVPSVFQGASESVFQSVPPYKGNTVTNTVILKQSEFLNTISTAQGIRRFWSVTGRSQGRHAVFVVRAHTKADAIEKVARHKLTEIHVQDLLEIGKVAMAERKEGNANASKTTLSQNDTIVSPPPAPVSTRQEIAKAAGGPP